MLPLAAVGARNEELVALLQVANLLLRLHRLVAKLALDVAHAAVVRQVSVHVTSLQILAAVLRTLHWTVDAKVVVFLSIIKTRGR